MRFQLLTFIFIWTQYPLTDTTTLGKVLSSVFWAPIQVNSEKRGFFMDIENIISGLFVILPDIADRMIIRRKENNNFLSNPDDSKEHDPFGHHQWGIITHTKKFVESFDSQIPQLLSEWNLRTQVEELLYVEIDGVTKYDLLKIAGVLHDIGKFARNFKVKEAMVVPDYKNHAGISEQFINQNYMQELERKFLLTSDQIDYIARCAGFHFELGLIREESKGTDFGYSFSLLTSRQFSDICRRIARVYNGFQIEIGLMFLADSLAKTDLNLRADSDAEVLEQVTVMEKEINRRGLDKKLLVSVKQRPLNIAVARNYLQTILER